MFRKQIWMAVSTATAFLALPAMAQQYPPQQQQYPYPQGQDQYQQQDSYPQGQYQPNYAQQVNYSPEQLDNIVSRIALYPDPLLAQIFAAATYPEQVVDAARWSDQHHYLSPADMARAIQYDSPYLDPAVQALLPFPSVLQMMANDMNWTASVGNAFLSQYEMLQDSVQRMRHRASDNGYFNNTNGQIRLNNNGPWMEIEPIDPGYIVVPYYDPAIVYYRPWRPGARFGISFGYGVSIGSYFGPWGWGGNRFAWDRHQVYINNRPWERRWDNRVTTVSPYSGYERRPMPGAARPEYRQGDRGRDYRQEQSRGPARIVVAPAQQQQQQQRQTDQGMRGGGDYRRGQTAPVIVTPVPQRQEEHVQRGRDDRERRVAEMGQRPVETHMGDRRREERRN